MLQPVHAFDEKGLENRISGWVAAVNDGNYGRCLNYVAPPEFTGKSRLRRTMTGGGEELLLFSGEKLLPLNEYQIKKIDFFNAGYESKVTIAAKVIYQRKPQQIKNNGATNENDMLIYAARITQRWILLNGKWYIKSMIRLQYLGPS
jgi:hydrogenase maturation factor